METTEEQEQSEFRLNITPYSEIFQEALLSPD